MKKILCWVKRIFITLILICLISFMINNRELVEISFFPLPFKVETRLFFALMAFFLVGLAFGGFFFAKYIIKNSLATKKKDVDLQS